MVASTCAVNELTLIAVAAKLLEQLFGRSQLHRQPGCLLSYLNEGRNSL